MVDVSQFKPVSNNNIFNTVLTQDSLGYNRLIDKITKTLNKIKKAINRVELMDDVMDKLDS